MTEDQLRKWLSGELLLLLEYNSKTKPITDFRPGESMDNIARVSFVLGALIDILPKLVTKINENQPD